jgi:hypothetical protein
MKATVTFSLATLLALPAASCAQERPAAGRDSTQDSRAQAGQNRSGGDQGKLPDADQSPRRLESVTWNSVTHELTWIISRGEKKDGTSYKALGSQNYLINMDDATMSFSGEMRRFSREEAANVSVLMDLIAKYAIDSTIWWDDGQGEPVKGNGKGTKEPEKPRQHDRDEDDSSTLHVADQSGAGGPGINSYELHLKIRQMERELEDLKRLQTMLGSRVQFASYSTQAQ